MRHLYSNIPFDFAIMVNFGEPSISKHNDEAIIKNAKSQAKQFSFCLDTGFTIGVDAYDALVSEGYSLHSVEDVGYQTVRFTVRRKPKHLFLTVSGLLSAIEKQAECQKIGYIAMMQHVFGEDLRVALQEDYESEDFHVCMWDGKAWYKTGARVSKQVAELGGHA